MIKILLLLMLFVVPASAFDFAMPNTTYSLNLSDFWASPNSSVYINYTNATVYNNYTNDNATFNTKINKTDIGEASGGTLSNNRLSDNVLLNTTTRFKVGTFARDLSIDSGTQEITGLPFKPSAIEFISVVDSTYRISIGYDDIINHKAVSNLYGVAVNTWGYDTDFSIMLYSNITDFYRGKVQSVTDDSFTISWTKTGNTTGTATISYIAFR